MSTTPWSGGFYVLDDPKNPAIYVSWNDIAASGGFIDKLNQRICLYADMPGRGNRPGYEMLCLLGTEVQEIMGLSQTNKWIQQQVIDIDGPDTVDRLHQVLSGLLDSAGITSPP